MEAYRMSRGVPGSAPKRKGSVRDFLGAFAPHVAVSLQEGVTDHRS